MLRPTFLTGCAIALSLLTKVNAQSSDIILSISTESVPSTTRDSLSSETSSISLASPTGTGAPCAQIASVVEAWKSSSSVSVPAQLAYDCLTSVRVKRNAALGTISTIEKMVQFQSNLGYMKNPPEGYDNPPVDILAGLADMRSRVTDNAYRNQYEFEAEIASLLSSGRDGHLGFDGPTYTGAVRWRRAVETVLISTSVNDGPPKIYSFGKEFYFPQLLRFLDSEDLVMPITANSILLLFLIYHHLLFGMQFQSLVT
jgi:hypothetical protein